MDIIELLKKHKKKILWSLLLIAPSLYISGLITFFVLLIYTILYSFLGSFILITFSKISFIIFFILIDCVLTLIVDETNSFFENKYYKKFYLITIIILFIIAGISFIAIMTLLESIAMV